MCIKITDGTHHTPKYVNHGIPFISVKDIREDKIYFENTKYITELEHQKLIKRCNPEYNDVLFTKIGTVGIAKTINKNLGEFSLFVSVALLKINHNLINVNYLSAVLNSKITKIQIDQVVKGIGVPDFHLENIKELKIPLPPREIQQELTEMMGKAYELKKQKETKALELLDSIDGYVMEELGIKIEKKADIKVFSLGVKNLQNKRIDPEFSLPEFTTCINSIKSSKYQSEKIIKLAKSVIKGNLVDNQKEGDVKVLRISDITTIGDIKTQKVIVSQKSLFLPVQKLQKNDLVFVVTGATIGKITVFNELDEYYLGGDLVKIAFGSGLDSNFAFAFLSTKLNQKLLERYITGATNKHLSPSDIEKLEIPLPPLSIQQSIATEVMSRRTKAKHLQNEAKEILDKAKQEFESSIFDN